MQQNLSDDNTKAEELATILYEDLKEKYILLKEENKQLKFEKSKLKRFIIPDISLRVKKERNKRDGFNFGLKIGWQSVVEYASSHNWDVEQVCELVQLIKSKKQPPIIEELIRESYERAKNGE